MGQFGLRSTIGFQTAFAMFWAGATAYLGYPDVLIPRVVARNKIERVEASPAQFQGMFSGTDPAKFDLSSLRLVVISGSFIPQTLAATIRAKICPVLGGHYGATELGMISVGPMRGSDPAGRCGFLVPWIEGQAVGADDSPLPAGEEGILRFRSAEMATGYLNDKVASENCFRDGWFYPGDTGSIGENLALTVTGRSSERINAGGVKVAPEVIEKVLLAYDGVVDCAAFGAPGDMGVEKICAAVVVEGKVDLKKLLDHCRPRLGNRAPEEVFKLDELPRNETGKILRAELPKLMAEQAAKKPSRRKKKV
jgi:acyl-coenzyme A synthetase/AMP-(fatty) acid ligase